MCGRYANSRSPQRLASEFDALFRGEDTIDVAASYNIAPTDSIYVVRESFRDEERHRVVDAVRWGLIPSWADDERVGSRMFNARSEDAAKKPAFRRSFAKRRCLVPADGWYEWLKPTGAGTKKQPYFMTLRTGEPIAFAGLWEVWRGAANSGSDEPVRSATVLTEQARGQFAEIHDRMPVVVPRSWWAAWLGEDDTDPAEVLESLSKPAVFSGLADRIEFRPVSAAVGSVKNNGAELTDRVDILDRQTLF